MNSLFPEIRSRIGLFLARDDLYVCALVNQEWNAIFSPILWSTIELPGDCISDPSDLLTLQKHAKHVRHLEIILEPDDDLVVHCQVCTNLVSLTVNVEFVRSTQTSLGQQDWIKLIPVLELNKRLSTFRILAYERTRFGHTRKTFAAIPVPFLPLWEHLATRMPCLRAVQLKNLSLLDKRSFSEEEQFRETLMRLFQQLTALELENVVLCDDSRPIQGWLDQELSLKELSLVDMNLSMHPFLTSLIATTLKSLTWSGDFKESTITGMVRLLRTAPLNSLQTLKLPELPFMEYEQLGAILRDHKASLIRLDCPRTQPSHMVWDAIVDHGGHATTLQYLDISSGFQVRGDTVQRILESCPNLEVLKAVVVDAMAIWAAQEKMKGRPTWICSRLGHLQVYVDFKQSQSTLTNSEGHPYYPRIPPTIRELQMVVHQEIGALYRLKVLDLNLGLHPGEHCGQTYGTFHGLSVRLQDGLGSWNALQRLQVLRLGVCHVRSMDEKDVSWLKSHLGGLKDLSGILHRDSSRDQQLVGLFKGQGFPREDVDDGMMYTGYTDSESAEERDEDEDGDGNGYVSEDWDVEGRGEDREDDEYFD